VLLEAIKERQSLGLTSVRDLSLFPNAMRAYYRLWESGRLNLRVSMALDLPDREQIDDTLRAWGVGSGFGDHWLRLDSLSEDPDAVTAIISLTDFTAVALAANKYGWRMSPHIGPADADLTLALDAFETANRQNPIAPKRWVVEHAAFATTSQMERMASLGVHVSATYNGYAAVLAPNLEPAARARIERQTPMREFLDHKLVVSAGSDYLNGFGERQSVHRAVFLHDAQDSVRPGARAGAEDHT
jgi:predicted amidohydrolase YtcJ